MTKHGKKIIAPVVVVLCLTLYNLIIWVIFLRIGLPKMVIFLGVSIPIVINIILIKVLIDRVKEIRKGEEDDLGKY
ncbi:MAG: hypothetical protein LBH44_07080 [Treponema sp.]|jgi:hypothetical protein|nr:hypothetical protein [Treponema sp.]